MLNVALLTAGVALATTVAADSPIAPAAPATAACHASPAPVVACPPHAIESAVPGDLASLGASASPSDNWAPVPADDGLAFKDAATDTASMLTAGADHTRPQRVLPALLALGALVILLRRRPS